MYTRKVAYVMVKLFAFLQGKLLVTIAAGTLLVGGATAAFAATPAGQNVMQSLTHAHATMTVTATQAAHHSDQDNTSGQDHSACPGMTDAQDLASDFHLSTSAQGTAVMAICALHKGAFKGTMSTGTTVTSSRVFGFGEIDQLLTYAQFLAAHDTTNTGGQLTDANVDGFLAAALHSCGSMPLEVCLKQNIPNFQPGQGHHDGDHGNGNNPTTTPTPNGNKPTSTPTPPHH